MKVFFKTFGCQMNKSDSERMLALLEKEGYHLCESAEEADVLIANTCSIRAKAEDKLFSLLGEWKILKKQKPRIIAVVGCIAQQEGEALRKRVPEIDIVLGTHTYHKLPEFLREIEEKARPIVSIGSLNDKVPDDLPASPQGKFSAWISVMQGCSNFCSYCIVPYTRGPEASRSPSSIKEEILRLVDSGFVEFTLLGQNVNVYGKDIGHSLPELFADLSSINGIKRLRFLTSHPRDLEKDLVQAVKDHPSVCEYFHLPAQAGSSKVLKEMNRGYDLDGYRRKVAMIREIIPQAAISTDLIVGFPGESEEDFQKTLDLVDEISFDSANTAAYSVRPHTVAGRREDQLPEEVKNERLNRLNALVIEVARRCNSAHVGGVEEVLIEEREKSGRYRGRSRGNKIVSLDAKEMILSPGRLCSVRILSASPWALQGELLS